MLFGSAASFARGATPVFPTAVCEEEDPAPPSADVRPVFPCALAESGALDASCADATFYVVTPAGVLLCQIDVDILASASSTTIERAPPAFPGSPSSSAVHALASSGADVPPPIACLRPRAGPAFAGGLCDGHGRPPPVPS